MPVALQAFSEDPLGDVAAGVRRAAGRARPATGRTWPGVRDGAPDASRPTQALAAAGHARPRLRAASWPTPRRPSPATARSSSCAPRTRRRCSRSSGCTSPPGRLPRAAGDLRQEAVAGPHPEPRSARCASSLARLYEDEIRDADKAIKLYRAILEEAPDGSLTRCGPSIASTAAPSQWTKLAATIEQELSCPRQRHVRGSEVPPGQVHEKHLDDRTAAVAAFRDALELAPTHEPAREALEVYLKDKKRQMKAVAALEPIYEANQDLPRLIEAQRIRLAEERPARGVPLLLRIGRSSRRSGGPRTPSPPSREAFREDPTSTDARSPSRTWPTRWASGTSWSPSTPTPSRAEAGAGAGARAAAGRGGGLRREAGASRRRRSSTSRLAQEIGPEDASALVALERLYTRHRALARSRRHPEEEGGADPHHADRGANPPAHRHHLGGGDREPRRGHRGLERGARRQPLQPRALRALDRLLAQKGLDLELADNLQRQLELTQDTDETVALLVAPRAAARAEARGPGRRGGDLPAAPRAGPRPTPRRGGAGAHPPDREHEIALAELLEPVYRARGDFPEPDRRARDRGAPRPRPPQKIALLHEIASAARTGATIP